MERKEEKYGVRHTSTDELSFHVPAKYGIEDNSYFLLNLSFLYNEANVSKTIISGILRFQETSKGQSTDYGNKVRAKQGIALSSYFDPSKIQTSRFLRVL